MAKVTIKSSYERKTILSLGTCIFKLSFISATCRRIKNFQTEEKADGPEMKGKKKKKDSLEELEENKSDSSTQSENDANVRQIRLKKSKMLCA